MTPRFSAPRRTLILLLLLLLCALPVSILLAQEPAPSTSRALMAESAGGILGSIAGTAIGLAAFRVDKCPVEDDVACPLERLSLTGVTSVVGATAGVLLVGRAQDTDPSLTGALVGSIVGAAAGVGVLSLTDSERSGTRGRVAAVLIYGAAQGVLSAAGSRIGARLRRRP